MGWKRPIATHTGWRRVRMSERRYMSQVSRRTFTVSLPSKVVWFRAASGGRLLAERSAGVPEEHVVEAGAGQGQGLGAESGTVEHADQVRDGDVALVDVEPDEIVLVARLAHERLVANGLQDGFGGPVDADGDDVPGDLALQLVGGAVSDDLAVVDDRQPVGQGVRLLDVMGRQEYGRARFAQTADLVPHPRSRLGIEAGGRLVEEEDRRSVDDAQTDIEPALHAARVRGDRPVRSRLEVECGEDLAGPPPGGTFVHAVE